LITYLSYCKWCYNKHGYMKFFFVCWLYFLYYIPRI
jgi:hypothetical protein